MSKWTLGGLQRIADLIKLTQKLYWDGKRQPMARALGQQDYKNLSNLERLAPTGAYEPQEETFEALSGGVWIPDLDLPYRNDDGSINSSACFTGGELQAIARGVITPRLSDDEDRPPLSQAILHQMELLEDSHENIAHTSGLPVERVKRVIAIGGWGVGSSEDTDTAFYELLNLGTWYGNWRALAQIYRPKVFEQPGQTYKKQQENGAHR